MCKLSIQIDWGTFFSLPNPKNLSPATNLVDLAIQIVIKKCQKKANRTSISAISVQFIFHETDSLFFFQLNQNMTTECINFSENCTSFVYFLIQVSCKKNVCLKKSWSTVILYQGLVPVSKATFPSNRFFGKLIYKICISNDNQLSNFGLMDEMISRSHLK